MKKIILIIGIACIASCGNLTNIKTDKDAVVSIIVPKGRKVISASYKDDATLYYLTRNRKINEPIDTFYYTGFTIDTSYHTGTVVFIEQ